jgi:hypothetical protein
MFHGRARVVNGKVEFCPLEYSGQYAASNGWSDIRVFYHGQIELKVELGKTVSQIVGGHGVSANKKQERTLGCAVILGNRAINFPLAWLKNGVYQPIGHQVSQGKVLGYTDNPWSNLKVFHDGRKEIGPYNKSEMRSLQFQVTGTPQIVKGGKYIDHTEIEKTPHDVKTGRHDRTAIGITGEGRFVVCVVDEGKWDAGMTLEELAHVMIYFGAVEALNGDGGGSSIISEMKDRTFTRYTFDELTRILDAYPLTRQITDVDMHHTWKPRKTDFQGEKTIYGIWNYHVNTNGWSDIGEHLTVDPDGYIWGGLDLNEPPASSHGFNGNEQAGPLMFETIGDFDKGQEKLEGKQLEEVVKLVRYCQNKWGAKLRFHRELNSPKTCPGTGIAKEWIQSLVDGKEQEGYPTNTPQHKKDGVEFLFENGGLSDPNWRETPDVPVTLWMLGDILRDMKN